MSGLSPGLGYVLTIISLQPVGCPFLLVQVTVDVTFNPTTSTGVSDIQSPSACWSQLPSRTSQRSSGGLACSAQCPLLAPSPVRVLDHLKSCQGQALGVMPRNELSSWMWAPACWRWENRIPPQLQHTHVFENLLGRQDLLIFSTSCD